MTRIRKIIANVDKVGEPDLLLLLSRHINALLTLLLGANLQPHFIFHVSVDETLLNYHTDMEFAQNFTPPDLQAKNFTPSISPNFNSFNKKKQKK